MCLYLYTYALETEEIYTYTFKMHLTDPMYTHPCLQDADGQR